MTSNKIKIIAKLFFSYISDFIDEARYIISDYTEPQNSIKIGDSFFCDDDKNKVYVVTDVVQIGIRQHCVFGKIEEAPTLNIGGVEHPIQLDKTLSPEEGWKFEPNDQ